MATIEIDGKVLETENGKMIIEVADDAGIHIPRFCYHKKLSVAANCRMCLVEVENSRKPVPACATPITNGMKVYTKSEQALHSQKAVMEFLLINHPLDCPICDQGGECELQDVSMGYGQDDSYYHETKRSVNDDNLGTLIETEMTRCIHCTRCVRFGDEIAGVRELGATGRGEHMQIGTYVEHSMTSEVSANIIDLCPVGALTSKPYRYTARAWELTQHDAVSPHDCLGTNIYLHVRRNKLMRVVPKENESINETWISDRDRFSYVGLSNEGRALKPQIKQDGQWHTTDWTTALEYAANGLARVIKHHGPEQVAAFASPSQTVEEYYLLQKLMRALGVQNIDYRLRQADFRDQNHLPVLSNNRLLYKDLEKQQALLMIGCNIHRELPLAGLKIRKANRNGAHIHVLNSVDYPMNFKVASKIIVNPMDYAFELAAILSCLVEKPEALPEDLQALLVGIQAKESHKTIANALKIQQAAIVTGALFENHPDASTLRMLTHWIANLSGCKTLFFTTGANAQGASLAGMLPHRSAAGHAVEGEGLEVERALDARLKAYVVMGVDPGFDFANPVKVRQAMLGAEFVVALTAFEDESMRDYADVILPIGSLGETSGTFINIDNTWQSFKGAIEPAGEARPGWKVLRVLGNLLYRDGFEYTSSEEILKEVEQQYRAMHSYAYEPFYPKELKLGKDELVRVGEWPLYRQDQLTRHSEPLQHCQASEKAVVKMNPITVAKMKLGEIATIAQGDIEITLPLISDDAIAEDVVWISNALPETVDLGHSFEKITIKR